MTATIRQLIAANAHAIVATFDAHDPGIDERDGHYVCPAACGWRGTEAAWEQHLAAKLGELLEPAEQLALV